jgi:flagellar assembly protein FliH
VDPIIRAAAVSNVGRRLRRHGAPPAAVASAAAPAVAARPADGAPIATVAVAPLVVAPADPATAAPAAAQPGVADRMAELACAEAQLRQRQDEQAATGLLLARREEELAGREMQLEAGLRKLAADSAVALVEASTRGHREGLARGQGEAAAEAERGLALINALLQGLGEAKDVLLEENEDVLVEIVFTALCRLLGESAASRAGVAAMVRLGVADEREPELLCVRLHPDDLALMTAPDQAGPALDPRLALRADAAIALGGCLVDGPRGSLDARLELQLQQLRGALLAAREERRVRAAAA